MVLASGEEVAKLKPDIEAIAKCPGGGIIATGIAPQGSGFDYYCRCFFPKYGINEVSHIHIIFLPPPALCFFNLCVSYLNHSVNNEVLLVA